jgi:alpha-mannosidase
MISALKVSCRSCVRILLPAAALLFACSAFAQQGSEFAKATALLPADSQTVVDRLGSLRELPDGSWKMHAGDLAHGEDVSLDDSSWQPIAVGAKTSDDAVWFRQVYTVPDTLNGYDLTGSRIWFQFHANANGPMPQILYFNGRRVALGDDLEPIVLFDNAKPGDRVAVAVKLLHTVDVKTFRGATLKIDFPENRPNPEDLREELLSAAVLIPSLAPGDASKTAALESAIHAVDIAALDAHDQSKFDASLIAAEAQLQTLKPMESEATFHLTGNAHIDAAWLWPWTETVDVVKRTFGTALQLMYEYPQYTYTQSAAAYNEWIAQKYPDMNAEIKQRIKEGRWEVVGGMWVEPDLNMPDGESLVRQLLVGKRWYLKNYGVDVRVGWNPDSFGYTWQLPQIYKKSGVDYFVTQKMAWNDTNQLPFKLFWWESPDGSKVLTYFPHDYVNTTLNPVRLSEDLSIAREHSPGMLDMMDLYGVGDHGGGPTRAILDEGFHHVGSGHVTPKYQFGTALSYFSTIETQVAPDSPTWNYQSIAKGYKAPAAVEGKIAIPTWDSELYFEYHRGVYTTQANHKHNMRTAEEEVLNAEKWSSLAWLDGLSYPGSEITEDWKKVLFNQFHDLAAGSGIGVIYKDAQKDYDVVRWSTNEISTDALKTIAERVDTDGEGIPVMVYNPLGWERSGDVSVEVQLAEPTKSVAVVDPAAGKEAEEPEAQSIDPKTGVAEVTFHVANVPALGYKVVRVVAKRGSTVNAAVATDQGDTLKLTDHDLSVTVDKKTGCITSLSVAGYESLAKGACGNELQAFKDTPKNYDAWNIDPGTLDETPTLIDAVDSVQLVGAKSANPAIRVTRTWQSSKFVQTITIPPGSGEVDVDNDFDWHERHVLLKAAFPLAASSGFATYEVPYAEIERPTTRNNSWEKAQFEVEAERWADLGDGKHGFSLINKDKYGYDAVGNLLRLSLLRAPTWPDPEADQGKHHFHYALYPHAGTWKDALTVRHGWEYDYTLKAVATTNHAGALPAQHSFASVGPDNVVLTAVKKAEDANGLIFRAYEWAGKDATAEFHVPPGATSATVTNLMETPEGSPLQIAGDTVRVPIHPFEILTIRVDYPGKQ